MNTASPWTFDAPMDVVHQTNLSDCGLHVLSWMAGKLLGFDTPHAIRLRQLLPVLLLAFWSHSCPDLFKKIIDVNSHVSASDNIQPNIKVKRIKRGGGIETADFNPLRDIKNYCGLVLNKASYFQDILNGKKIMK